jgi:hypothetical protein
MQRRNFKQVFFLLLEDNSLFEVLALLVKYTWKFARCQLLILFYSRVVRKAQDLKYSKSS